MITVGDAIEFAAFLAVTVAAASILGIQMENLVARIRVALHGGAQRGRRGLS